MKMLYLMGALSTTAVGIAPLAVSSQQGVSKIDNKIYGNWFVPNKDKNKSFSLNSDKYWELNEEIYSNNIVTINYIGSAADNDIFSFKAFKFDNSYQFILSQDPFDKRFSKECIKDDFGERLANLFSNKFLKTASKEEKEIQKNKMAGIIYSSNKSGNLINDDKVSFKSSWGVGNSDTGSFHGNFYLKSSDFNGQFSERIIEKKEDGTIVIKTLKDIVLSKIQIMPSMRIDDAPISEATFTLSNISVNGFNKSFSKFKPILPDGAEQGTEWWHGLTSSLGFISGVFLAPFTGGSSILYGVITSAMYSEFTDDGRHSNLTIKQKSILKEFSKNSATYYSDVSIKNGAWFSFNGEIWGYANATAVFGNNSKMSVDDLYVYAIAAPVYDVMYYDMHI